MRRSPARACALFVLLSVALCSIPAAADTASEANLQYELGAELYKQKRYAEAIERFIASERLVPNANVVLNIVQTFEFLKRYKDAYNWFQTYLERLPDDAVRQQAESQRAELASKVAVVEVTTAPAGAELFVDRVDLGTVGTSPRRIAVDTGDRTIIARLAGHHEGSAAAAAREGQIQPVAIALTPILGGLSVQTKPPGATVRLDPRGQVIGQTPLLVGLPVGTLHVAVSLPGYSEQTRDVTIAEGATATLDVELVRPASSVATLSVSGNVPGAVLRLDGSPIGQAPTTRSDLAPGQRRLDVESPKHDKWSTTLLLEPGASTRVDYRLVGPDDRAWPGWRWVGYGTGAALLIAGGIVGAFAVQAHNEFDQNPSRDLYDSVRARNLTADVLLGAGAAVAATTLVWDLLSGPRPESSGKVTVDR
jgi:hypothetical protein